jgi:hypothetical protein
VLSVSFFFFDPFLRYVAPAVFRRQLPGGPILGDLMLSWIDAAWQCPRLCDVLHRFARFSPATDSALPVGNVGVAHLLKQIRSESGATATGAVENDPAILLQFFPMVGQLGIGVLSFSLPWC